MKKIIKITLSLLFIAASFTSCVDDKDFDTPQVACDDSSITNIPESKITSFSNVISTYTGTFSKFVEEGEDEVYFIGYVSSSDLKGNFYKEIYIQDKLEDPTYAVKLNINIRGMYAKYPIGSKLYIKLNGLAIDKVRGELTIGENNYESLDAIRESYAESHIFRNCTTETLIPIQLSSNSMVSDLLLGKLVQLNNTQFDYSQFDYSQTNPEELIGYPFVDPNNDFDTHRFIVFCEDNSTIKLETSSFAAFAELPITHSKFNITGILTRDYGDDFYVLKINSIDNIEEIVGDRCDPLILNCGYSNILGNTSLLEQDFDSGSFGAWTTYIEEGSKNWEIFNDQYALSGNSAKIGSFGSNDTSSIAWLISPAINMDAQDGETLEFQTSNSYADDSELELLYSNDWDGTNNGVATATWYVLAAANIVSDLEYYQNWVTSGLVDLSCAEGTNTYIAFKYTGSGDSGFDGTYELDDIKIKY